MYIPTILVKTAYNWHIPSLYHVYIMYFHVYTGQIVIYQLYTRNIHGMYSMVYTMYIILIWYRIHVQSIYRVYTECIHNIYWAYTRSIYIIYTSIYQVHTTYIPSTSNKKAWRRWKTSSLDLRWDWSVWILVCAVIGLHSTWQSTCIIMPDLSDWSSVQCHKHSNLKTQDMK